MTLVMRDVHLAYILRIDDIISIENKISVKSFGEILLYALHKEVQSIAFADVLIAVALVYDCASSSGYLGRPVVAVVCTDEDLYLFVGVILVVDAVDEFKIKEYSYAFLICARNEELVIGNLIDSINHQHPTL